MVVRIKLIAIIVLTLFFIITTCVIMFTNAAQERKGATRDSTFITIGKHEYFLMHSQNCKERDLKNRYQ